MQFLISLKLLLKSHQFHPQVSCKYNVSMHWLLLVASHLRDGPRKHCSGSSLLDYSNPRQHLVISNSQASLLQIFINYIQDRGHLKIGNIVTLKLLAWKKRREEKREEKKKRRRRKKKEERRKKKKEEGRRKKKEEGRRKKEEEGRRKKKATWNTELFQVTKDLMLEWKPFLRYCVAEVELKERKRKGE